MEQQSHNDRWHANWVDKPLVIWAAIWLPSRSCWPYP